jgi:transcriptional regulator of met regulon
MFPFLLQPVRGAYNDEYLRLMEQRRAVENSRGASKSCIECNTFPHKFRRIPREKLCDEHDDGKESDKKLEEEEEEEEGDKCTICLCGKLFY